VKTVWQAGRALARALRGHTSRALRNSVRVIGPLALASAILLLSLGVAHAQTATTTTITAVQNPSSEGHPVIFTATVVPGTGGTPTGTVTFLDGSSTIGTGTLTIINGQSQATFTTSALTAGSHTITASYGGDGNFSGSTASLTQRVVVPVTLTTTSSPNPSVFGQSVTITATVTNEAPSPFGPPTGSVQFLIGNTNFGPPVPQHRADARHHYAQRRPSRRHDINSCARQPQYPGELRRRREL
jgi:hypothetical protein